MDQFVTVGSQYVVIMFTIPPNLIRSKIWDSFACSQWLDMDKFSVAYVSYYMFVCSLVH